jgi:hypothetical protein
MKNRKIKAAKATGENLLLKTATKIEIMRLKASRDETEDILNKSAKQRK